MNTKRMIAAVMVAAMGMTTAACNETTQGFASGGVSAGSSSAGVGQLEDISTEELDAELASLEKALVDVEAEIAGITILSLSEAGSDSSVQSKGLDDKVAKGIRKVFDAVHKAVDKAQGQAAKLRAKVNGQLAKLDPLNPLHIALVMKLQDLNKYLDRLDGEISGAIQKVVELVDDKVGDLDDAVAKLNPKNPLSAIAMIYWAKLKLVIVECNDALAAKI